MTDWEQLPSNNSIDVNWNLFIGKVMFAVNKHVPKVFKQVPAPWWTNKQLNINDNYTLYSGILCMPLSEMR